MKEIVAVDIGGTHARFAIATVDRGRVLSLSHALVMKTADHVSIESAWECFARSLDSPPPTDMAMAFAGPVLGDVLKLTNNRWIIRPAALGERLGVDRLTLVNDFGAIGHAVAQLGPEWFTHLCGPDLPLPNEGVISIVGPGTGLGVAQLLRSNGNAHVTQTEGGHIDFAPLDEFEDSVVAWMRKRLRRVSVERVVSGPGLANLYAGLGRIEGRVLADNDDSELWTAALAGSDRLATAALDRFCLSLGSFAGDIALAQGAAALVIAGGLGQRLAAHLPRSGFAHRFVAKGRFERHLAALPVRIVNHPEPGLFGAAAAFAQEHGA